MMSHCTGHRQSGQPGDAAGRDGGGEVVLVDVGVVVLAEQGGVEQAGGSTIDPVNDMMRVTPKWWSAAPGEGAAFVPDP
jgi:hypothetical protein